VVNGRHAKVYMKRQWITWPVMPRNAPSTSISYRLRKQ